MQIQCDYRKLTNIGNWQRFCRNLIVCSALTILAGCSVQKSYFDADMGLGNSERRSGNLSTAEQHYRAAVWRAKNHLGDKEISGALYNLGQNQRLQGRYKSSVESLFESISYAAKTGSFDAYAMGRRHAEIAASYAELGRWKMGVPHVRKLIPIQSKYAGKEAEFLKFLFQVYKENLAKRGEDISFLP